MKLKKYVKFRKSFDGVSVNNNNIYLSNPLVDRFEGAKYAVVLFDVESRIICIKPANFSDEGAYRVTKYGKSKYGGYRVGVRLAQEGMPKTRYIYKNTTKDGIICIAE